MTTDATAACPTTDLASFGVATDLAEIYGGGEIDRDWLEFLALGLRADPAVAGTKAFWRNAPVLLAY